MRTFLLLKPNLEKYYLAGKFLTEEFDENNSPHCGLNLTHDEKVNDKEDETLANTLLEAFQIPEDKEEVFGKRFCKEHFQRNLKVEKDGSLTVSLPFKPKSSLGENYKIALSRFFNIEKTLSKNTDLNKAYHEALKEMIDKKQVGLVTDGSRGKYYLPHHPVVKIRSPQWLLSPVFDGSCVTSKF